MLNLSINRKLQRYTVLKAQFLTIPSRQKLEGEYVQALGAVIPGKFRCTRSSYDRLIEGIQDNH